MTMTIIDTIAAVLARAPEWLRHDLIAKDHASRARAEDALAAMIAAALETENGPAAEPPGLDLSPRDSR